MTAQEDGTTADWKEVVLEHVNAMSPIAQAIFLAGVKAAFVDRVISAAEMEARTTALLMRHKAGEELTVADLESIGAPQTAAQPDG